MKQNKSLAQLKANLSCVEQFRWVLVQHATQQKSEGWTESVSCLQGLLRQQETSVPRGRPEGLSGGSGGHEAISSDVLTELAAQSSEGGFDLRTRVLSQPSLSSQTFGSFRRRLLCDGFTFQKHKTLFERKLWTETHHHVYLNVLVEICVRKLLLLSYATFIFRLPFVAFSYCSSTLQFYLPFCHF